MKKRVLKYLGIVSLMIGIFFILGNTGITGNVIINEINSTNSETLGLIFIILGVMLMGIDLEKRVKINGLNYDEHAVQKMEQRNLFPMIVEDTVQNGEHYTFIGSHDNPEYNEATDIYVMRDSAVLAPGKIGKRTHKDVGANRSKRYASVVVLTDENGVVKTCFTKYEGPLDNFLDKYAEKSEREAA